MTIAPPGYYPAQGDPAGSVRYWDGEQWSAEPMPPPPGYDPSRSATADRYATVWVRIGASLLDGLINGLILLPFLIPWFIEVFEDVDAGGDGSSVDIPNWIYGATLVTAAVMIVSTVIWGATVGKLIVGLRITKEDATTTPPGLARASLRTTPLLAGLVPVVGPVIGFGIAIWSLISVNTDPERRSAYDRIAGTRVVYKRFV